MKKSRTSSNVAIVYDRANSFGGAERVLLALKKLFPKADLFTSVLSKKNAEWVADWNVMTSFLQRVPFFRTHHQLLGLFMPIAFESFDFSSYDLVISVTSEAAKGIITKPGTNHICYLLTPTRYLWSHQKEYEDNYYVGIKRVLLPLHRLAVRYLQRWDIVAANRPNIIIPISLVVKDRCEKYYKRKTEDVIYPPVDTSLFRNSYPPFSHLPSYYLCVSRLVPYKRIDLAIDACMEQKKHLVIIGKGSDEERLKKKAGNSSFIHFEGYVGNEELVRYYQHCNAVIFPGEEDFGIVALEAMAAGKPVIVYSRSGVAGVVRDGLTGVHLQEQNREALLKAIDRVEKHVWNSSVLKQEAEQYNEKRFLEQWRKYI